MLSRLTVVRRTAKKLQASCTKKTCAAATVSYLFMVVIVVGVVVVVVVVVVVEGPVSQKTNGIVVIELLLTVYALYCMYMLLDNDW